MKKYLQILLTFILFLNLCQLTLLGQVTPVPKNSSNFKKMQINEITGKELSKKTDTTIITNSFQLNNTINAYLRKKDGTYEVINKESYPNYSIDISLIQIKSLKDANDLKIVKIKEDIESKIKDSKTKPENQIKNDKDINDFLKEIKKIETQNENEYSNLEDSLNAQKNVNIVGNRWWSFPIAYNYIDPYNGWAAKIFNKNFYGKSDLGFIQSSAITRVKGITNITSELVSDYWGTFRWSVFGNINAVDASVKDTAKFNKESAIQRFATLGGQFAVNIQTPLFYSKLQNGSLRILLSTLDRFSIDAIKDGSLLNAVGWNNQIGGDLYIDKLLDQKTIRIFVDISHVYVWGNNPFYSNFDFRDFNIMQGSFGIAINGELKVKAIGTLGSSQSVFKNSPWQIGLQYSPPASN